MTTKLKQLASIAIIATFLIAAYASSEEEKEKEVAEAVAETPAIEVTPDKLFADYEANEVAADLKYKDKVLIVNGKVNTIAKDITDGIYITLSTGDMFGEIQCSFSDSHINEAAALQKGQIVTVKGKCEGKLMNVLMGGCSLQ